MDLISLLTWVAGIKQGCSPRKYLFWRHTGQKVPAEAETLWGFVDLKTGRPVRYPKRRKALLILSVKAKNLC